MRIRLRAITRLACATALVGCNGGSGGSTDSDASAGTDTIGTASATTSTTGSGPGTATDTTTSDSGSATSTTGGTTDASSGGGSTSGASDSGPKFDVLAPDGGGGGTSGGGVPSCKVNDGGAAIPECKETAPPAAFDPEVQWFFEGVGDDKESIVTPLVANLTDDDNNGEVDLCDTPDVLVVASPTWYTNGKMVLVDGGTGTLHFQFNEYSDWAVTPAIGDIDDDGLPEIVGTSMGANASGTPYLAAWENDGTLKWTSTNAINNEGAIGLADVDNDGDVEIYADNRLFDHNGTLIQTFGDTAIQWHAPTAADLDGDGDLEIVMGRSAWHHDGSMAWMSTIGQGQPQVADVDDDGLPEVVVCLGTAAGFAVLNHDGSVALASANPPGDSDWRRPAALHDLDGDGEPEIAVSSGPHYGVYEATGTQVWVADVLDGSGLASGTAFDFLGDGIADAIYGDETDLYVFGENGSVLFSTPRTSGTLIEYPVVADVDNDTFAEIIVPSNKSVMNVPNSPLIQAIKATTEANDMGWVGARRIWNQHTYHVTNVREDSTIPQFEDPNWDSFNTFRTQAQLENGGTCKPPPPG